MAINPEIILCCRNNQARFSLNEALKSFPGLVNAADPAEALALVEEHPHHIRVIVADLKTSMEEFTGLMLSVHRVNQDINLIAMGEKREARGLAQRCIEAGAHNFVTALATPTVVRAAIRRGLDEYGNPTPFSVPIVLAGDSDKKGMVEPHSPFARKLDGEINDAAASQLPTLIQGATGTGKELVARELHRRSSRKDKPFVTFNCAALPDSMVESILFGYRKGAFTGAIRDYAGIFEQADGGVLLLDELGELALRAQAVLLRVLQERRVTRLGSTASVPIDVWIICSTNRNLKQMMAAGEMRADFGPRLFTQTLELVPLAERVEDVAPAAKVICARLNPGREMTDTAAKALAQEAQRGLFPDNFRGLENRIAFLISKAAGREIGPELLEEHPAQARAPEPIETLDEAVRETTRRVITAALLRRNDNKSAACRDLGVSRNRLYREMQAAGMSEWIDDAGKAALAAIGPEPKRKREEA